MNDFTIIPAIELRGGMAIQYEQTAMSTRANRVQPLDFCKQFKDQGATRLHLYNLDGAFKVNEAEYGGSLLAGAESNLAVVQNLSQLEISLQLSGGVRDYESLKMVLQMGASRVALGTAGMRNPDLVKQAIAENADAVIVYLDCRNGRAVTQEWVKEGQPDAEEVGKALADAGVKHVVYQDTEAETSGISVALPHATALAKLGLNVVISSGVHSEADVKFAAGAEGVSGVLVGKLLTTGATTVQKLQELITG
ncbi:HisA/HisF-related TIM barrel protein [Planctomycetota bacterium]|nr:HisA/HisF-related TIM barrel protein [Planctomycetota bacterium]